MTAIKQDEPIKFCAYCQEKHRDDIDGLLRCRQKTFERLSNPPYRDDQVISLTEKGRAALCEC